MFSCNVNADVSLLDVYLTLSEQEKQTYVNYCRLENFPKNTSNLYKGDICTIASTHTVNKISDLRNDPNDSYGQKTRQYLLEALGYKIKACNFYYLVNANSNVCKLAYKQQYELYKCNTSKSIFCHLLQNFKYKQ